MDTERALIATLSRTGAPEDWTTFVTRNQAAVYRTCLNVVRRPDLAEDAAQETFLAVLRHGDQQERAGAERGWLHRVALNSALQILRGERRRDRRDRRAGMDRAQQSAPAPGDGPLSEPDRQMLRQSIEALPARWRVPLLLRYEEGLTYREISDIVAAPEGTVARRLHEAIERLRETLSGAGFALLAGQVESAISTLPPWQIPARLLGRLAELGRPAPTGTPPAAEAPTRLLRPRGASTAPAGLPWAAGALTVALLASLVALMVRPDPESSPARVATGNTERATSTPANRTATPVELEAPTAVAGPTEAAAAPVAPRPRCFGRLVDAESGRPLDQAQVTFAWEQGKIPAWQYFVATTDATGAFTMEVPEEVRRAGAVLRVTRDGWARTEIVLQVSDFDAEREWRIPRGWEIEILVKNDAGLCVTDGVQFWLDAPDRGRMLGAEDLVAVASGTWRVPGLDFSRQPPKQVRLRVQHPDYDEVVLDHCDQALDSERRVRFEAVLSRGRSLMGSVRAADGRPLAGVVVSVWPADEDSGGFPGLGGTPNRVRSVRTDVEGRYTLVGLPPGKLALYAEGAEHAADRTVNLETPDARMTYDWQLPPAGVIEGVVVGRDGAPLANTPVTVDSGFNSHPVPGHWLATTQARTDSAGRFRCPGLRTRGEYTVDAGAGALRVKVTRAESHLLQVEVVAVPMPDRPAMVQTARMHGEETIRFPQAEDAGK